VSGAVEYVEEHVPGAKFVATSFTSATVWAVDKADKATDKIPGVPTMKSGVSYIKDKVVGSKDD